MRKLISTILALCMVLCLLPVTAAADDANPRTHRPHRDR